MKIKTDNYEIYKGDCLEIMAMMENESVDLVVTDPPYKTTSRGGSGNSGGMCKKKEFNSGKVFAHNEIKPQEYIPELYRVLKEGTHCYVMTNHVNLYEILTVAQECGFHFIKSLVWNKGNKIMGQAYMSQFEYILFFRKGKFKKINKCGTADILEVPNKKQKGEDGKNLHDTEKPVELMKILIENSSQENDVVFEPFMGIGSTVVASLELNRRCIGVELDEKYFEISKSRLNEAVEKKEELLKSVW